MPPLRYTVHRRNWMRVSDSWHRLPGSDRVASFASQDAAEAERDRLEAEARRVVNPFACGTTFADRSHLDEGRFRDWLLDAGLEPPEDGDWGEWWEDLPEEHDRAVWDGLDRVRFYDVVAAAEKPVVYVVVGIPWNYTDQDFYANESGGIPTRVFRSRDKAERYCRDRHEFLSDEPMDMSARLTFQADPLGVREGVTVHGRFSPAEEGDPPPMFEIVEVEVGE
jgi:hypothetical protein